ARLRQPRSGGARLGRLGSTPNDPTNPSTTSPTSKSKTCTTATERRRAEAGDTRESPDSPRGSHRRSASKDRDSYARTSRTREQRRLGRREPKQPAPALTGPS